MGPKKEVLKKENSVKIPSLDDPINSSSWNCAVVMAVEKTSSDSFVLKEFMDEAVRGRRQEVKLINFETFVLKVLNDFVNGELPFKYSFLLNFLNVFQQAAEYASNKADIPVPLLVKVVKALLFFFREESLIKIEKKALGPLDPIKAMADRPADIGGLAEHRIKWDSQQLGGGKEKKAPSDEGLKVRPPSTAKQETKLLKRGEGAKEDECIDDAPINGFFDLYVLLTGFYSPDFTVELIKAGVPLHGLLCIDTSMSGAKIVSSSTYGKFLKRSSEERSEEIQRFWDSFLKLLWDPKTSHYFKDTVFQVYIPQRLLCEKNKLKEFIYKEISYLMYDLSDLKRQLKNYLRHMKLRDVSEPKKEETNKKEFDDYDGLPNECITVPTLLQHLIDAIATDDEGNIRMNKTVFSFSIDSSSSESSPVSLKSPSVLSKYGSVATPIWSQVVKELGDFYFVNVFIKIKELDTKYNLEEQYCTQELSQNDSSQDTCAMRKKRVCAENMEEALNSEDGVFRSYFRKFKKDSAIENDPFPISVDYCLYALLFTKVHCQYGFSFPTINGLDKKVSCRSGFSKKNSFELIENLDVEMRKPHFTVTNGSRNVLNSIPYNVKEINKDFFSLTQFKIVSPEKLKASSAPEFYVRQAMIENVSFISELARSSEFFQNFQWNVFENLRQFLGGDIFANAEGFDFVEELNKPKMVSKEDQYWGSYNCVDCTHSVLGDFLLLVLHNRKNRDGTHHETFNEVLKTKIGLRDFFEYILEDEHEWLKAQEELFENNKNILKNKSFENCALKDFSDSSFWMDNSIKYQEYMKFVSLSKNDMRNSTTKTAEKGNVKKNVSRFENINKFPKKNSSKDSREMFPLKSELVFAQPGEAHDFEGYDISDMAVQFSGLKTTYFAEECGVTVELIERLYENQDLGIHICQGGHTLHLHSYACPVPHLFEPFAFHLSLKSGIILAFQKRFIEIFEEVEEMVESRTSTNKNKKTSSEMSTTQAVIRTRRVSKNVEDKEFLYDMKLSLPNGLSVTVERKILKPCYIKQKYIAKSDISSEAAQLEICRLLLPNGDVVKMGKDNTVQVLKANTSILTASLNDWIDGADEPDKPTDTFSFDSYEMITSTGQLEKVDKGRKILLKKFSVFQNTDLGSNTIFCRRKDGTDYMMQSEGILCVKFKDGTKISSFPFVSDAALQFPSNVESDNQSGEETSGEADVESDFLMVHLEVTVEHPEYASVIYNTLSQRWKILLPFDSAVTVESEGIYSVDVDKETELKVGAKIIQMSKFNKARELLCSATADLSVFENSVEEAIYCRLEDKSGKTFVVESNSNCYVRHDHHYETEINGETDSRSQRTLFEDFQISNRFVDLNDLSACESSEKSSSEIPERKLSRENKYLVVRKDITGLEVLHKEDVRKILTETEKGSVIFTQEIPGEEKLRCFVLISPAPFKKPKEKRWQVPSIIPEPKLDLDSVKTTTSSTYGQPPSWLIPFPKRKEKFQLPAQLTCRVFVETKKTDLNPSLGSLECRFCEIDDDLVQEQHFKVDYGTKNLQDFVKKLSNDDQDILKKMYAHIARNIITSKKISKSEHSPKLLHYLQLSKYYVDMQEYHKKCIRYHDIPKYFHHPAGMSWLLLNDLLDKMRLPDQEKQKPHLHGKPSTTVLKSESSFSNEEVEYDLVVSSEPSFSDLSCRTDVSAHTAPAVLIRKNICTCKISDPRLSVSAPICKIKQQTQSELSVEEFQQRTCAFLKEDIELLEEVNDHQLNVTNETLNDLMALGLI